MANEHTCPHGMYDLENCEECSPNKPASEKQVGGDHYKTMKVQPSEYIYQNGLDWYEGNAVKYITRHRLKGGKKDILKAIHYLQLLLEAEYGD